MPLLPSFTVTARPHGGATPHRPILATPRGQRTLRRLCFAIPVLAMAAGGTWMAADLTAGAPSLLRPVLLALLFGNLLFLAATGWPGVIGAAVRLLGTAPASAAPNGTSRTAILFPVYNEDPHAVFTAVEVMAHAMRDHRMDAVDIFVLSDTRDAAIAAQEDAAFNRLQPEFGNRVRYRRRTQNLRRKVGNIADFCDRWHADYDYMVVLDADSLMSAQSVSTLIGLMDANPRTGLIQSVPYAFGRETLFARMQQFAARLYTPLLVQGLAFWQQGEANYWGHNAIIRIAPFMAHCELPVLPGKEPFGGEILCHDVVEAGLMHRAGWDVWLLPQLGESYEALPANLIDFAQRERRWCQGNLQHTGVLPMRGLRAAGRYHLALGVLNYLSGPLLAGFTGLALADGLFGGGFIRTLLGTPGADGFILLTAFMLYGAKLCSLLTVLADDDASAQFGGRLRLLASAALEQAAAMVTAPVLLLFYTRFITMMLLGRTVRWDAQPRDDRGVSWQEATGFLRLPLLTGFMWLAAALAIGGPALHWSLALIPGLLLAAPFAVWTSQASLGVLFRRFGLFLTEDEVSPTPILRAFTRALARPPAVAAELPRFAALQPVTGEAS